MCSCVRWAMAIARTTNDSRRGSTPPERRVRKWVLVHTVPMHQLTSGLMEQTRIYRHARNHPDEGPSAISPGSLSMEERTSQRSSGRRMSNPHVCHSNVPGSHEQSPSKQRTTQPGSATIAQLQMGIYHMKVQGRFDLHLTYGAKPRRSETPTEALDLFRTSLHHPKHGLWTSSTQGCDIRWRNMARPLSRRREQVIN